MLSALLALALVLGGAAALITYAWQAVDQQEVARETQLVQRALDRNLVHLAKETTSAAAWDDAYRKTSGRMDLPWIDRSFAAYYHVSFQHDLTFLVDFTGSVPYAARDGQRVAPATVADLSRAATPWVRYVQEQEMRRRISLAPSGSSAMGNIAWRTVVVRSGAAVYVLGVSTIGPNNGVAIGDDLATVVVTGWRLDSQFLNRLEQDLGIRQARLVTTSPLPEGAGTAALVDPRGRHVASLTWTPAKPGVIVLRHAARAIVLVFALLGLVTMVLGYRIRQLFIRLHAHHQALEASMAALVEARDAAQAANVSKSEFVANISHEIRTPLNGILGMAQVLERDELTPPQHQRVRIIGQSGKALLTVLNDLLDISKMEAGKLDISDAPFDLAEVVAATCAGYQDVADARGLVLEWRIDDDAQGVWLGDAVRIKQILLNLVSNALKFTEAGRVEVEAHLTPSGVRIDVRDEGMGISTAKLPQLFQKFSQVDGSDTRRFGGTGLGLAICRELALLMNGEVTVTSEEGRGSLFSLQLPLERSEPGALAVEAAEPLLIAPGGRLRVLAAEDNEINQRVLRALLEPLNPDLVLVADGARAVEACRAPGIDLVLMDVQMPIMNGVEATRLIRAAERLEGRRRVPIIALTANTMHHQLAEYAAAGMDGHVAKPVQVEMLYAAIAAVLEPADDGEALAVAVP
jgi:signal transduction histidine kinase/AmiR/NasT family two-component response regulator